MWGHGFVFMKQTNGAIALSGYLAKYMSKSYLDTRLVSQKAYSTSRNIKRPLIQAIPYAYDVLSDYELSPQNVLQESKYRTQWLGECKRSIYQIKIQE